MLNTIKHVYLVKYNNSLGQKLKGAIFCRTAENKIRMTKGSKHRND